MITIITPDNRAADRVYTIRIRTHTHAFSLPAAYYHLQDEGLVPKVWRWCYIVGPNHPADPPPQPQPQPRRSLLSSFSFPPPPELTPTTSDTQQAVAPATCPSAPIANLAPRATTNPPILPSDTRTTTAQTLRRRRRCICPPFKPRLLLQCHRVTSGPPRSSLRPHATPHNARRILPST